jgi:hypothetical protein
VSNGLAYLAGERVVAVPLYRDIGLSGDDGKFVELPIQITNLGPTPIEILGLKVECQCTVADALPLSVLPRQGATIMVKSSNRTVGVGSRIVFYTNSPAHPQLVLPISEEQVFLGIRRAESSAMD